MFFRLYKTRLKCLYRNYETIFWSFGFPILLSIFFYMGFYKLNSHDMIDTIPIVVIMEDKSNQEFLNTMQAVKISDDKNLFEIQDASISKAKLLLEEDEIAGYIVYENSPLLYVKKNGFEQTIIKSFLDSYKQMNQTAMSILAKNPNAINEGLMKEFTFQNYVVDGSNRDKDPNVILIYFYSLIALTCLFGTNWGYKEMLDIQANQSAIGARINVAPTHKIRLLLSNLLAAFTLHMLSILFLFTFLYQVLKIDFGEHLDLIMLTCLVGAICGISLGAMVCVTVKANSKVRNAILNVIVMGGGFLAGMMMVDMKYLIATKAPIVGYLNPASLIVDALYSLYYYDGFEKFTINIVILGVLSIIFGTITYLKIRRREYASI